MDQEVEDIVAPVVRFEPAAQDPAGFALLWLRGDERHFLIDHREILFPVWAELLAGLAGSDRAVYVEAEISTRHVTRILLPRVDHIVSAVVEAGRLVVRTLTSPRELWADNKNKELKRTLQWAAGALDRKLLLAIDPGTEEILTASPFELPDSGAPPALLLARTILSEEALDTVFVSLLRCHIPFDYLRDGCATRAHEMFRLLSLQGIQCDKVWLYAPFGKKLILKTPAADVSWLFHVAPRVKVQLGAGVVTRVLDPSTFLRPVHETYWAKIMTGHLTSPPAPVSSDPKLYGRLPNGTGTEDPTFSRTAADLQVYRTDRASFLEPRFIPSG